jgi:hypothetical protein
MGMRCRRFRFSKVPALGWRPALCTGRLLMEESPGSSIDDGVGLEGRL